MSKAFRLFVYGQLKRGQIGYERLRLEQHTQWLGPARVHGRLHEFGDYPGLVLGGAEVVHGELLAFDDPALWAVIDAYEECDLQFPALSEYRRVEIDLLDGGRAQTYEYNQPIGGKPVIADGGWPLR